MPKLYEFIRVKDGTWALPFTKEKAQKLYDLLCTDKYKDLGDRDKIDILYNVLGDDQLLDDLEGKFNKAIVKKHLKRILNKYDESPDYFRDKIEKKAKEILENIFK